MNKVVLSGRLVRDPEMRVTQNGKEVTRFTVAVDRKFSKDGERSADFINCTAFNKSAEFIAEHFKKGSGIEVEGKIQTGSYEKEGQKINTFDVIIDSVEFPKGGGSSNKSSGNPVGGEEIVFDDNDLPF